MKGERVLLGDIPHVRYDSHIMAISTVTSELSHDKDCSQVSQDPPVQSGHRHFIVLVQPQCIPEKN
jgi:hypothetical protein